MLDGLMRQRLEYNKALTFKRKWLK